MTGWTFHDPLWLCLLALLPLMALLRRRRSVTALVVPSAAEWHAPGTTPTAAWPVLCVYAGLALLIVAMARPQFLEPMKDHKKSGYDFIIAIDLSTSMYAEDFQRGDVFVNRLQAIKPIISAFINERPDDRIGIVTFAGRAYTFAPLTFDHEWLRKQTSRLSIGLIEDGTAIGDAIGVSLKRLAEGWKETERPREGAFIVLLTDGSSNKGSLDPRQGAKFAADESVAIYTIAAGAEGKVPMPIYDYQGNRTGIEMRESDIDVLLLRDIAETTGGAFFRATDQNGVAEAFEKINQAAKVDFDAPPPLVSHEAFYMFALLGIALMGLGLYAANYRPGQEQAVA